MYLTRKMPIPICPPEKILNPATNRCVLRRGTIGRRLVGCQDNEILNPTTGRCVKRNGALGRRILRQQREPNQPPPAPRPPRRPRPRPRVPPRPVVLPGPPAIPVYPTRTLNRMTKPELLEMIRDICYNDDDPITFEDFADMTVDQLRSIVRILDNGGVDFFSQRTRKLQGNHQKFHCILLESIRQWLEMELHRFPRRLPKHPVTGKHLTPSQIDAILGPGRSNGVVNRNATIDEIIMNRLLAA
jgi:hypothetical protein